MVMNSDVGPKMHILGVPVDFPYAPYRAQVALMHAVIKAASSRSHALVESPTGTGKSLALLCSSLAVQSHIASLTHSTSVNTNTENVAVPTSSAIPSSSPHHTGDPVDSADSDAEDFQPVRNFRDVSWQLPTVKERKRPAEELPENAYMLYRQDNPLDLIQELKQSLEPGPHDELSDQTVRSSKQVPRVFYATRTHAQVAQVVSELRKTSYRPSMCILASRREYCLHEVVRDQPSRDDACKRLVADSACPYFFEASTLAFHQELKGSAWDIEELSNLGSRHGKCPYYASHELYRNARLILCPYSFLVDPIVRNARGINLSEDIIILDEAHNIENYAREAAGFETDVAELRCAVDDVETALLTGRIAKSGEQLVFAYRRLKTLLESLLYLIDSVVEGEEFVHHDNHENAIYERQDMLRLLGTAAIDKDEVKSWKDAYDFIVNFGDGNEAKRFKKMDVVTASTNRARQKSSTSQEIPSLTGNLDEHQKASTDSKAFGYGYGCDSASGAHKSKDKDADGMPDNGQRSHQHGERRGRGRGRRPGRRENPARKPWGSKFVTISHTLLVTLDLLYGNTDDFALVIDRRVVDLVTVVTLKIHCLNAAVCFRDVSSKARSVVVASGTLSPMSSFAGELGTSFAIRKSLPHVVDVKRQLFVAVAGEGPRGIRFDATYHGSARFDFQDALGDTLIDFSRVTPGGILVFFPSYRMMDIMRKRWQVNNIWAKLIEVKSGVFVEPAERGEEFDRTITEYHVAANSDNGALLLGVCRGKLSEGIDFRDDASRAVVLVGIPFPHKNDVVVSQKRLWNDRARLEGGRKELQSGAEWYEMQAFRALNQALGRVVRHRFDYGAILLLDARFRQERVLSQLPCWTREAVKGTDVMMKHDKVVERLDAFYKKVHVHLASISAGTKPTSLNGVD